MKNLKRTTYKSVGQEGYRTVFLPTNERVQENYVNGKRGDQLWHQLTNEGLLTGNLWTEQEIMRQVDNVYEIPNPRDNRYEDLIKDFHNELFNIEADLEKINALETLTMHNQLHRSRLMGEKKALESVIIKLKKSK